MLAFNENQTKVRCTFSQGGHNMTIEHNKQLVYLTAEEVWSKGNLAIIDEIYAPDFEFHFIGGLELKGLEALKDIVQEHRTAFPDWNEQIEDIIAEGDRIAIRFTSRATHQGDFRGIPPTGNRIKIAEAAIYRIAEGKIAEQWGFPDEIELLRQVEGDQ
jgi:steroid delta-isomerase-like uncharacterized protein